MLSNILSVKDQFGVSIAIILTFMTTLVATAQDEIGADSTKIRFGKSTIIIVNHVSDDVDYDFGGHHESSNEKDPNKKTSFSMDIGVNGYLSSDNEISLPSNLSLMEVNYARSRTIGFNVIFKGVTLARERLFLSPGIGVTWNGYFFNNSTEIFNSNGTTNFIPSAINYDKYKLRIAYLQIPLLLSARIGNYEKPFGLQFGAIGSLRLSSMIKQKYTLEEARFKNKVKDDFNINPFKLDLTARIAYDDVGLYVRYGLNPLFQNNKGPEVYPISIGFTFGGF